MREGLVDLLRVKPARTASGVAVVTVMTTPHACPHGVCTYCPGGPRLGTPQSYLGTEPAARRAADHRYDPRLQAEARLASLRRIGHDTDKVDLIVLGGTFTALDRAYRTSFIKGCFDGLNGSEAPSLVEAQDRNESARARCIGLTVETKPDCFLGSEVEESLALGTTRVEIGLQSTHDDVLERVHRGGPESRRPHDARPPRFQSRSRPGIVPRTLHGSGLPPGFPQNLSDPRPARHRAARPLEIGTLHATSDGRGRRADRSSEGDRASVVPDPTGAARNWRARHRGRGHARRPASFGQGAASLARPRLPLHPMPRGRLPGHRSPTRSSVPPPDRLRFVGGPRNLPSKIPSARCSSPMRDSVSAAPPRRSAS